MIKLKNITHNPLHELRYVVVLAAIQFVNVVDFVIMMPLGPTLIDELSITPVQFGTLISAYSFSGAGTGFLFGLIADKYDRKNLLILAIVGFMLTTLACGLSNSFGTLLTARIFTGVFGGILTSLIFTIVSDLIPFERRGKAMGIIMSSFSIASVLGVPLGLAISDATNWQNSFHFIVLISIPMLILSIIIFPSIYVDKPEVEISILKSLKNLLSRSKNLISFILIFLVSGSMFLLIPYLSTYAVKNMQISTTDLKYAYMVGGFFTIITARIIGKLTDKLGALNIYAGLVLLSSIPILIFTHSGPLTLVSFLVLQSFFMTLVSGRMIPCMTLVSEVPEVHERGLFMSTLNSIRALGRGIMTFLAGFLIVETSDGNLSGFDTAGILSIAIALITIYLANKVYKTVQT